MTWCLHSVRARKASSGVVLRILAARRGMGSEGVDDRPHRRGPTVVELVNMGKEAADFQVIRAEGGGAYAKLR